MEFASPAIRFKEEEKTYYEDKIDAIGNVTKEYEASAIQIVLKILKASDQTKTASAKIVVTRYVKITDGVFVSEKLIDGTDYEAIVNDVNPFDHSYKVEVIGDDIRVLGLVRWW